MKEEACDGAQLLIDGEGFAAALELFGADDEKPSLDVEQEESPEEGRGEGHPKELDLEGEDGHEAAHKEEEYSEKARPFAAETVSQPSAAQSSEGGSAPQSNIGISSIEIEILWFNIGRDHVGDLRNVYAVADAIDDEYEKNREHFRKIEFHIEEAQSKGGDEASGNVGEAVDEAENSEVLSFFVCLLRLFADEVDVAALADPE
ncbi:unnamed protein product [Sphagnum balticum]